MDPFTPTIPQVQRIRRLSNLLAAACVGLMILLPVFDAAIWSLASVDVLSFTVVHLAPGSIKSSVQPWQRFAGAALMLLPILCQLAALRQARACFLLFAKGSIFVSAAVRTLRRFTGWMFASILVDALAQCATGVVMTMGNPPGERILRLAFGVDTNELIALGTVWLMALVIGHGQAIADENATFV